MHADQTCRVVQRCTDILERNGGCVRRHDRAGLHLALGIGKDGFLDRKVLCHRLDQQVGAGQPFATSIGAQTRHRCLNLLRRLQTPLIQGSRTLNGTVDRIGGNILKRHFKTAHGGDGGNITAHRAGTDHMDLRDVMIAATTLLHRIRQLEIAPHASRGRRHHKLRKQIRFCFHHIVSIEF